MILKRLMVRRYHDRIFRRNKGNGAHPSWTKVVFGSLKENSIYSITKKDVVNSWLLKWKLAGI